MKNPFKGSQEVDEETQDIDNENMNTEKNEASDAEVDSADGDVDNNDNVAQDESEEKNDEKVEEKKDIYKEKYEALNNQYVRLAADFDNFRKRQEQEKEDLLKYGAESSLKKMIEVLDNFERGLEAIKTVENCDKLKECYNLAYKNFTDVLKKLGLEEIEAAGKEFDPNFHEAVMQTPTSEKPENTIVAELQKGYKLGDKVLRPTLVNVAVSE